MELKDFIVQTVLDIDNATKEVHEKSGKALWLASDKLHSSQMGVISFDLMVAGETKTDGKASIGINVLGVQLGDVGMTGQSTFSNSSRIKFSLHY